MNKPNNPQSEDSNHEDTSSPSNTPLQDSSRRAFVRKSLAAGVLAAQPSILAGLIRANGGGGGETTTSPWGETTAPPNQTTMPWTTQAETTYLETTYPETTSSPTEDKIKTFKLSAKIYYRGPVSLIPRWGLNAEFENGTPGGEQRTIKLPYQLPAAPSVSNGYPPLILVNAATQIAMTQQTILSTVSVPANEDPTNTQQIPNSVTATRFDEQLSNGKWVSGYVISVTLKVIYPSSS